MKIQLIIHEAFESPGAIEVWGKERGHALQYCKVYANDTLPCDAHGFDFLIVMGGPQSPNTSLEECPHFNASAEIALIQKLAFFQLP